ncbi:phage capsid protein [Microbacterium sp. STF-2]|uniref:major capsid protein n=1 Tax=Microbacterium sp. STF-2 TaxID=3031132 RepID=UPI002B000FCA|nr:phage capsid protein [Microbacterium sp. STF-2]MEA1264244.1 phage capsid protein [Microbacterium sp. STF-2]
MPVTLIEAKSNAVEDLDVAVIDEFRKESAILDELIFDDAVNPVGGGATLDYGYRRLATQRSAAFRAYNTEYTPEHVTTTKVSVTLAPLGGSFEVDRVLAKIGPAASGSVALNLQQTVKSTVTKFQDAVINGDTAVEANGFDGLDKALTGSTTEINAGVVTDWRSFATADSQHAALDVIDEFLSSLDGAPTVIFGNAKALAKIRAAARRADMYVRSPLENLAGPNGRPIVREQYGDIVFMDPGAKAGSNNPIIPIETRTVATVSTTGLTDLYAVRIGMDGFHGVSTAGGQLVQTWLPDFTTSGAVKKGEVELGPVAVALKSTKAAAVLRNIRVQ